MLLLLQRKPHAKLPLPQPPMHNHSSQHAARALGPYDSSVRLWHAASQHDRAAARRLPTVCPYCNRELADSSGIRHTVQLPVIGSVGAGKTRLLMAAIVQLESWLTQRQGR